METRVPEHAAERKAPAEAMASEPADADHPIPVTVAEAPVPDAAVPESARESAPASVPVSPMGGEGGVAPSTRLVSLDAFRGLTILGMLLVNNAFHGMAPSWIIEHAPWRGGVYFADFVFPWFLFIVGVAVPWSYASYRRRGGTWPGWAVKAAGRTVALVLLGCLIDSSLAKRPLFDLDVLQLIGLAYFVGATLYALPVGWRLGTAGALLVGHWALLRFGHAPGAAPGTLSETENVVRYLNEAYLARFGLKGLVSVMPTGAMVLLGTAAGDFLRRETLPRIRRAAWLALAGVVVAALGWLWSFDLLFSKELWTAPYILYTAGCGAVVLAALFAVVDAVGWKAWCFPLVVFGSNAIVAYVAPILTKIYVLREWAWPGPGPHRSLQQGFIEAAVAHFGKVGGEWVYTGGYILVWWVVLLVLYRRKLFLRV